jgi:hypothetical protein
MKDRFVSFVGSHIHGTSLAFQVGVVVTDGTHPPFRTAPHFPFLPSASTRQADQQYELGVSNNDMCLRDRDSG